MGPLTGRGAGFCAGARLAGNAIPGFGRMAHGGGCGRGRRQRFFAMGMRTPPVTAGRGAAYAPEEERLMLQQQIDAMQGGMELLQQRLAELGEDPRTGEG
jgi:hypothetical protein